MKARTEFANLIVEVEAGTVMDIYETLGPLSELEEDAAFLQEYVEQEYGIPPEAQEIRLAYREDGDKNSYPGFREVTTGVNITHGHRRDKTLYPGARFAFQGPYDEKSGNRGKPKLWDPNKKGGGPWHQGGPPPAWHSSGKSAQGSSTQADGKPKRRTSQQQPPPASGEATEADEAPDQGGEKPQSGGDPQRRQAAESLKEAATNAGFTNIREELDPWAQKLYDTPLDKLSAGAMMNLARRINGGRITPEDDPDADDELPF